MKRLIGLATLFVISCSGPADEGLKDISGNDSIGEMPMNDVRLTAVEFNNEMTFMQNGMLKQMDDLFASDSTTIEINHENTLFEVQLNIQNLESIKAPEKSDAFLTAMIDLMKFYESELQGQFKQVITLVNKAVWSKDDEAWIKNYDENFVINEKAYFDSVFAAQEEFAKLNNIKLEQTAN